MMVVRIVSTPPKNPRIFHITYIRNLAGMIGKDLLPDAKIPASRYTNIGASDIKQRRLRLPVGCHPGTCVGDYVPFYFSPRSVMLFRIARSEFHEYRGGQQPIVHLRANLHDAIDWAEDQGLKWAFTNVNAAASYAPFYKDRAQLDQVDWEVGKMRIWRDHREAKQAEFLMHDRFPFDLFDYIGCFDDAAAQQTRQIVAGLPKQPAVAVENAWYY